MGRLLSAAVERRLKNALGKGSSMTSIALKMGMSEKYIRAYLADRLELRERYRVLREESDRQRRRAHFMDVLSKNAGVPIKRIRRISGNGFEWLRRNDLDWLREQLPGIWHR